MGIFNLFWNIISKPSKYSRCYISRLTFRFSKKIWMLSWLRWIVRSLIINLNLLHCIYSHYYDNSTSDSQYIYATSPMNYDQSKLINKIKRQWSINYLLSSHSFECLVSKLNRPWRNYIFYKFVIINIW